MQVYQFIVLIGDYRQKERRFWNLDDWLEKFKSEFGIFNAGWEVYIDKKETRETVDIYRSAFRFF